MTSHFPTPDGDATDEGYLVARVPSEPTVDAPVYEPPELAVDDDRVQVWAGSCLDVLRGDANGYDYHLGYGPPAIPDGSVHSVVTDPPYNLTAGKKGGSGVASVNLDSPYGRSRIGTGRGGFMGKGWDDLDSHQGGFQGWCQEWAEECLRVLKPGGYLLAFGGSRTWHRLACGIEDAGFELRDSISWVYGCLTADTEILTETGWRLGIDVEPGELVAQWDPDTEQVTLAPVERTYRAPWDGSMRVLRNADTHQLLTPNHRVFHRARVRHQVGGIRRSSFTGWQVAEAGALNTWNPIKLPVAGFHDGPGIGADYAAVLAWVWTEGGFDTSGTGVRIYQSATANPENCDEIAALLDRVGPWKRYERTRTYRGREYVEVCWFVSGDLARRIRADLPGKRPSYGLLWRMSQAEKEAFYRSVMLGDGSHVDSCPTFHQKHKSDLVWMQTLLTLIGRSGKVSMRNDRDGGEVYVRNSATTELQARHLRDQSEDYTGDVWCVKVPTGAFVARRKGRVFITGNSGFPKNHDLSTAIDKHLGVDREVIGHVPGRMPHAQATGWGNPGMDRFRDARRGTVDTPVTVAATPEAAQWEGWGTALKPAQEPIVVARKPLEGTVAGNVLAHGAGGLNVDGCRVEAGGRPLRVGDYKDTDSHVYEGRMDGSLQGGSAAVGQTDLGRWPTNLLLTHSPECVAPEGVEPDDGIIRGGDSTGCVPGCPVLGLDAQSGVRRSSGVYAAGAGERAEQASVVATSFTRDELPSSMYADEGGAARFFPTFRYSAKAPGSERPVVGGVAHPTVKPLGLMRFLVRLVTPAGGSVLELFAGSGTTVEAAFLEGLKCVAIERGRDYVPLIRARLDRHRDPVAFLASTGDDLGLFEVSGEPDSGVPVVPDLASGEPAEPEAAEESA